MLWRFSATLPIRLATSALETLHPAASLSARAISWRPDADCLEDVLDPVDERSEARAAGAALGVPCRPERRSRGCDSDQQGERDDDPGPAPSPRRGDLRCVLPSGRGRLGTHRCGGASRDRLAQVGRQRGARWVAVLSVFRHRPREEIVEIRRQRRRRIVQVSLQHGDLAVARIGRLTREAVVDDAAERVEIRASVERLAANLLRAAVVDGAEERAGVGHRPRARPLRESEVAEVGVPAAFGEQDVRRLQVAVDQVRRMRRIERAADLLGDPQRLSPRERARCTDHFVQARPVHVSHGEIRRAVDLVRVVDRDHVRMVERRREP